MEEPANMGNCLLHVRNISAKKDIAYETKRNTQRFHIYRKQHIQGKQSMFEKRAVETSQALIQISQATAAEEPRW